VLFTNPVPVTVTALFSPIGSAPGLIELIVGNAEIVMGLEALMLVLVDTAAVTVTAVFDGIVEGAVYRPLDDIVPAPDDTLHTAVPADPPMIAVNCNVLPRPTILLGAEMLMVGVGDTIVMTNVLLIVLSVDEVARKVTLALTGSVDGAV
jgi:hypothetical protein